MILPPHYIIWRKITKHPEKLSCFIRSIPHWLIFPIFERFEDFFGKNLNFGRKNACSRNITILSAFYNKFAPFLQFLKISFVFSIKISLRNPFSYVFEKTYNLNRILRQNYYELVTKIQYQNISWNSWIGKVNVKKRRRWKDDFPSII